MCLRDLRHLVEERLRARIIFGRRPRLRGARDLGILELGRSPRLRRPRRPRTRRRVEGHGGLGALGDRGGDRLRGVPAVDREGSCEGFHRRQEALLESEALTSCPKPLARLPADGASVRGSPVYSASFSARTSSGASTGEILQVDLDRLPFGDLRADVLAQLALEPTHHHGLQDGGVLHGHAPCEPSGGRGSPSATRTSSSDRCAGSRRGRGGARSASRCHERRG